MIQVIARDTCTVCDMAGVVVWVFLYALWTGPVLVAVAECKVGKFCG